MTQTTESGPKGLAGAIRGNPATERLLDEAKKLARAEGARLVGQMGERVSSAAGRLGGIAGGGKEGAAGGKEGGGQATGLLGGLQRLAQGESPGKAMMGTAAASAKEKIKGLFKRGKKGGGEGPLKAVNIEETLDIGVPVSVAYDQWTQFQDFAKFMKGVEAVEPTSETEQTWRVKVFKSRRSWKAKTMEQVPDRRIAWTSEGAKGSTKGVVTFHPLADDLTRVLLAMEYYPSGFMEKTGNIWRAGGRRARLDLKHFRRFVMTQGEATGSWRGEIRDGEVVRQPEEEPEGAEEKPAAAEQEGAGKERGERREEPGEKAENGEAGEREGEPVGKSGAQQQGEAGGEEAGGEEAGGEQAGSAERQPAEQESTEQRAPAHA